jgi:hypothetical protein
MLLALVAATLSAQKTIFSQAVGNDTFRLKVDACLWPRYHVLNGTFLKESTWTRPESSFNSQDSTWHGFRVNQESAFVRERSENTFDRAFGFVGVTAQFSKYAYLRYYYDQGETDGKPAYDLFAGTNWAGFDFRFGQLKLPLGYEVISAPWKVDFVDNALISKYRTPTGATRDIGALLGYTHRFFQASVGVMNGNGRNKAKDDNPFKDLAFRLAGMPLGNQNLVLGLNGYWGNDTAATRDRTRPFGHYGAELLWLQPAYFVRGEYLTGSDTLGAPAASDTTLLPTKRSVRGFYVAGGYRFGMMQPVLRYEDFDLNGKSTSILTAGVNAFLFKDVLKPMLDFSLTREEKENPNKERATASSWKVAFQLQAAFW